MPHVIFYEKPGCINNTKQKTWLEAAGHDVTAKNILETRWTRDELRLYFGDRPVNEWFNTTAPDVKSGKIVPESLNSDQALDLMVSDPILIKRPLLCVGDERMQGFSVDTVDEWIGLAPLEGKESIVENLQKENLSLCPMMAKDTNCDDQAPEIPQKPLSLIMEITESIGFEVTYEFDDLVFISHNVLIYRFTPTGSQMEFFFNRECDADVEQRLTADLINAGKARGITFAKQGYYTLSDAGDENISIEFFEGR